MKSNYDLRVLALLLALVLVLIVALVIANKTIPELVSNAGTYLVMGVLTAVGINKGGPSGS